MIYHVHSAYTPKNSETARRMQLAKLTWSTQPWKEIPVFDSEVRVFQDRGGKVPYVKDILDKGAQGKDPSDILVFTNSDICVRSNCAMMIAAALQGISAAYCFRRDFGRLNGPLPDKAIPKGHPYVGSDLYALRVGWWKHYREDFPDMLLGRECWDAVLRLLIDYTSPGQHPTLQNLIYHEWHASTWEAPQNRGSLASQQYNQGLARAWMRAWGYNPRSIGI